MQNGDPLVWRRFCVRCVMELLNTQGHCAVFVSLVLVSSRGQQEAEECREGTM